MPPHHSLSPSHNQNPNPNLLLLSLPHQPTLQSPRPRSTTTGHAGKPSPVAPSSETPSPLLHQWTATSPSSLRVRGHHHAPCSDLNLPRHHEPATASPSSRLRRTSFFSTRPAAGIPHGRTIRARWNSPASPATPAPTLLHPRPWAAVHHAKPHRHTCIRASSTPSSRNHHRRSTAGKHSPSPFASRRHHQACTILAHVQTHHCCTRSAREICSDHLKPLLCCLRHHHLRSTYYWNHRCSGTRETCSSHGHSRNYHQTLIAEWKSDLGEKLL